MPPAPLNRRRLLLPLAVAACCLGAPRRGVPEQRRSRGHAPIVPEARGRCTPPAAPPPPGSRPPPPVPGRITSRTGRSAIRVRSRSAGGVAVWVTRPRRRTGTVAGRSRRTRRVALAPTIARAGSSASPAWVPSSPSWSAIAGTITSPAPTSDARSPTTSIAAASVALAETGHRRGWSPARRCPGPTVGCRPRAPPCAGTAVDPGRRGGPPGSAPAVPGSVTAHTRQSRDRAARPGSVNGRHRGGRAPQLERLVR
jgi:hypothetical protein